MDRIEDKAGGIHLIPNNITEDEWHSAPEQTYTEEYLEILREDYNIFYDRRSCHAFKVIPREKSNPLIQLFCEDDGMLYSTQIMFDAIFACPFIDTLQLAIKEINDKNLWKCKEANFK